MLQGSKVGKSGLTDNIPSSGKQIGDFLHGGTLSSHFCLISSSQFSSVGLGLSHSCPRLGDLCFTCTDVSILLNFFLHMINYNNISELIYCISEKNS